MSKISELPIQRSDGEWDYIDLHETGTFEHEPLLIQLSDGRWGVPYLQQLGNGDTGLLVQDSAGNWWQANKQGILTIEDWETGVYNSDRWNWEDTDFSGSSEIQSDITLYGNYAYRAYNYRVTAAMPDYPDPAPYLPYEVGDVLQFHFQMPDYNDLDNNQQYWAGFLMQTCPHHTTTSAGDQTWDDLYTAEAITGSNDLFRISKRENGSVTSYTGDGRTTINWEPGVFYRIEVYTWSDGIEVNLFKHLGDDEWEYLDSIYGPPPKWSSGGILMRSGGDYGESIWDDVLNPPQPTPT